MNNSSVPTAARKIYDSKPSGQSVMKDLAALRGNDQTRPLLGADVVEVIAATEHGVAARALQAMQIDQAALCAAARNEASNYRAHHPPQS